MTTLKTFVDANLTCGQDDFEWSRDLAGEVPGRGCGARDFTVMAPPMFRKTPEEADYCCTCNTCGMVTLVTVQPAS